jgi:hypothetical protein
MPKPSEQEAIDIVDDALKDYINLPLKHDKSDEEIVIVETLKRLDDNAIRQIFQKIKGRLPAGNDFGIGRLKTAGYNTIGELVTDVIVSSET